MLQSAGPLRGIKRAMYEGGIRVPMIVRWPGHVPAGVTNDFPWAFWDFLPTAAAIAGAQPPPGLDGQSVLPVLLGKTIQPHEFFYWEFHEGGSKQAVRTGDWKAVRPGVGQPLELYDLRRDLGETNNVALQHPEIIVRIEAYLKSARTPSEKWPLRTPQEASEASKKIKPGEDVN